MTHLEFEFEFKKLKTKWKTYYTDSMEEEAFLIVKNCTVESFQQFTRKALWTRDAPNLEAFLNFRDKHSSFTPGHSAPTGYLNDEENKEFWSLLWDVYYQRISPEERDHRIQILETAVKYRKQGA